MTGTAIQYCAISRIYRGEWVIYGGLNTDPQTALDNSPSRRKLSFMRHTAPFFYFFGFSGTRSRAAAGVIVH
jgi:hypothetical protein